MKHRRSIRLSGYDHSRPGAYFVTLCVQNRECLFGKIVDGQMVLNDAGTMIEKWHLELPNKFTNIKIDEHIVMPNHFHSIIIIVPPRSGGHSVEHSVGADLRVCPSCCNKKSLDGQNKMGEHAGSPLRETEKHGFIEHDDGRNRTGGHAGSPLRDTYNHDNVSSIMQWFKTMTTNEYIRNVKINGWPSFAGKLWQRNFYDHIGRDDQELLRIRQYIRDNPINWDSDEENPNGDTPRYVAMLNPQRKYL
jgi:putative transposase